VILSILGLCFVGYVASVIFVIAQVRRAPVLEVHDAKEPSVAPRAESVFRANVRSRCQRCEGRRAQRLVRPRPRLHRARQRRMAGVADRKTGGLRAQLSKR
jgi:hypothetical protein